MWYERLCCTKLLLTRVDANRGRHDVVVHSEKVGRIELPLKRREAR